MKCAIVGTFSSKFVTAIPQASLWFSTIRWPTREQLVTGFAKVIKFMAYNLLNIITNLVWGHLDWPYDNYLFCVVFALFHGLTWTLNAGLFLWFQTNRHQIMVGCITCVTLCYIVLHQTIPLCLVTIWSEYTFSSLRGVQDINQLSFGGKRLLKGSLGIKTWKKSVLYIFWTMGGAPFFGWRKMVALGELERYLLLFLPRYNSE